MRAVCARVCVCTYVQLFCLCNLARTYTHLSQKGACTQHATVCKLMRHILKFTGDFMLRGDQTHARLASRTGAKIWKEKKKKKTFVLKSTGERSEQNRGKKKTEARAVTTSALNSSSVGSVLHLQAPTSSSLRSCTRASVVSHMGVVCFLLWLSKVN